LYRYAVRRYRTARCPRPRIGLLAAQSPRLRRMSCGTAAVLVTRG